MAIDYSLCTLGIQGVADRLVNKLEAYDLPNDYDSCEMYYRQILADVRHQYTNYDQLLRELPLCFDYWEQGGFCPHDLDEGECPLISLAHDTLKWEAKQMAKVIYTNQGPLDM